MDYSPLMLQRDDDSRPEIIIIRGRSVAYRTRAITQNSGELAEWSNAAVLKTVDPKGSGGSNPSLSAINKKPPPMRGLFIYGAV